MTILTPTRRWTPEDPMHWTRRAYGRKVVLESEGGTLCASLVPDKADAQVYVRASVTGRMLVEIFCNGRQIISDLFSNEELDLFIDLEPFADHSRTDIEVHFIPATNGTVSISRDVQVIGKRDTIFTVSPAERPVPQPSFAMPPVVRPAQTAGVLSKLRLLF